MRRYFTYYGNGHDDIIFMLEDGDDEVYDNWDTRHNLWTPSIYSKAFVLDMGKEITEEELFLELL